MAKLIIDDLHVRLGGNEILKGISATFQQGEIVALLGRSGSGKTTLLRSIAGLEQPNKGAIRIGDAAVFDAAAGVNLTPEKRNLGLVFQSYALWPHKTVFENVAYGLKLRGCSKPEITARVEAVLEGVGLGHLGGRYPHQMSGGQQQRVALARALVYSPPVILLDEPLSNLDAKLREEARIWIRTLIKRLNLTAVFVTHDQVEAMAIADRIVLLDDGRIVQSGSPEELYNEPRSLFASEFMGVNNTVKSTVREARGGYVQIDLEGFALWGRNCGGKAVSDPAVGVIRLEQVAVAHGEAGGENTVRAELETSVYLGGHWEHVFRCGELSLRAFGKPLKAGPHWLHLPPEQLWVF
ncbi:ABC transporter ATP-binding protein [Azospirillum sp. TSO22-1]|uniref:ABC transporter ATP-binding protein n=1 Tax=Azospirillum sp. TSO22-1 TaxID=716789 RepID=UPI000D61B5C4|nr:ABC transporter ATP-binding protein [Azospirillum sp. TSO22-1]PWC35576.1 lipase [Azospirillum sp. TSO22-1]